MLYRSLVSRLLDPPETRDATSTLAKPSPWLEEALTYGTRSRAGAIVTERTAMQAVAVLSCVQVIAQPMGFIPLQVFERDGDSLRKLPDHDYYPLLHDNPNDVMVSSTWRELGQTKILTRGNHYAELVRKRNGAVQAIEPITEYEVKPFRGKSSNRLLYRVGGSPVPVPADRMLHVPGLGWNGVEGFSPVNMARNTIGLNIQLEDYASEWFAKGGRPPGFFSHPDELGDDARERLEQDMRARQASGAFHEIPLYEEGITWQQMGFDNQASQMLDSRVWSLRDIARLFRVFPHLIGDLEKSSYASSEHLSIEFVRYTLYHWVKRWEETLAWKLWVPDERKRFAVRFNFDGLLRPDAKTRHEIYTMGRNNGVLTVNDILRLENMPTIGPEGDVRLQPLNMVPLGTDLGYDDDDQVVDDDDDDSGGDPDDDAGGDRGHAHGLAALPIAKRRSVQSRRRLRGPYRRLLRNTAQRIVRKDVRILRRLIKQHTTQPAELQREARGDVTPPQPTLDRAALAQAIDAHYTEFPAWVADVGRPVYESLAEAMQGEVAGELGGGVPAEGLGDDLAAFTESYNSSASRRYVARNNRRVQGILEDTERDDAAVLEDLEDLADTWEQSRADQVAQREVTQASSALYVAAASVVGVIRFRWIASGENCSLCDELDGKVVGRQQTFAQPGQTIEGDGSTGPLTVSSSIRHPPLHDGCDCDIVAE